MIPKYDQNGVPVLGDPLACPCLPNVCMDREDCREKFSARRERTYGAAPTPSAARKAMPLFSGCMMYFPDALLAVAEHSRKANDKHNPGEPLHWSKEKSKDHADCIARHLLDIGKTWDEIDPEFGSLHATALAWRALALLQTVIERKREDVVEVVTPTKTPCAGFCGDLTCTAFGCQAVYSEKK